MMKSVRNWLTVIVIISAVVSFNCDVSNIPAGDGNNPINSERGSESDSTGTHHDEVEDGGDP